MKQLLGPLVAATAVVYLWVPARAIAQPIAACEVAGGYDSGVEEYVHGPGLALAVAATSEGGDYAEVRGSGV